MNYSVRKNLISIILLAAAVLAFFVGRLHGAQAATDLMQQSCESSDTMTELNGQKYVCLTSAQWNAIAKAMQSSGA